MKLGVSESMAVQWDTAFGTLSSRWTSLDASLKSLDAPESDIPPDAVFRS